MSYSVRLSRSGTPLYTFATNPFLDPAITLNHDDSEPPRLTGFTKTWTLEGLLIAASETAVSTAYTTLLGVLTNPSAVPDAVELLVGGSVVESISVTGGYRQFRVLDLGSPRVEGQWRNRIAFTMRVQGEKRFAGASGLATAVADLTYSDSFSYDEAGLLTRTLSGELTTDDGTSAIAQARLMHLTLPGTDFGYVTGGPEHVDVDQLDGRDTRARFTCTIRQTGVPIPAGSGPGYLKRTETRRAAGEQIVTTTVTARGSSAEAVVRGQAPAGALYSSVVTTDTNRGATGTFVVRKVDSAILLRAHSYAVTGGGREVVYTRRTGDRDPVAHKLSRGPVQIVEDIELEVVGAKNMDAFLLPAALTGGGLVEDASAHTLGPVRLAERGLTRAGDKWTLPVRRVYRAPSRSAAVAVVRAVPFDVPLKVTVADEIARIEG